MCVCVCVHAHVHACTIWREKVLVGFWFETIWNPNSSIMVVFSFRLSVAAEDKIIKSFSSLCLFSESVSLQPGSPGTGAAQLPFSSV